MSQDHPHYEHAPIQEALIDIRVEPSPGFSVSKLKNFSAGESYPTIEPQHTNVGQIQFGPSPIATASSQHSGFIYKSADLKQILQAQVGGFTFSRLAPYQKWEPFSTEAKRLWTAYRSIAKPVSVTRVAVRYINRIDIPLPLNDFKDYLRTVPEVSPDLPQALSGYLMQLVMPLEDKGMAVITETPIPAPSPNFVSIVLDIDVSVSDTMSSDSNVIWETFEKLRGKKNLIFNACLTAKAKELFK
jgi:uncharacterized protein (TIGR04255 family)